jgi:hypothetical protein
MKGVFVFIALIVLCCTPSSAQFSRTNNGVEARLARLQREVAPLYRKPTKKELKSVEPSRELSERYASFLRGPNTGLVKLIADKGCAENSKVLNVSPECLRYTMPGAGSSFSFRTGTYRIPRLSDITYTDNSFQASGVLLHGIFVNIGNVPLEEVNPSTKGLKWLFDFRPEPDFERGRALDRQLTDGIHADGFLYRRGLYIVENATFVLRSIAYGGKYPRAAQGITYNELEFDRRRDVTVAFRIVERDGNGDVTIAWRELQDRESPAIEKRPNDRLGSEFVAKEGYWQ